MLRRLKKIGYGIAGRKLPHVVPITIPYGVLYGCREHLKYSYKINGRSPDELRPHRLSSAADSYVPLPTAEMHSSSTSTATSASSLVTTSAGQIRTVLGPQPRKSTPRSNAISTIRSRSALPYSFVA